jgi:DNA-binding NarL/FixJ family response regulator
MPARPARLLTAIARLPHRLGDAPLLRIVLVWALVLAAGAFALQWLQYQYVARVFSPQLYIAIIGTAFAVGGVWVGWRLSARPAPAGFARNEAALKSLGLTGQEMKVLEQLAMGHANKEIALKLGLSPSTVKTHVGNLYAKLEVASRGQAVNRARALSLIP